MKLSRHLLLLFTLLAVVAARVQGAQQFPAIVTEANLRNAILSTQVFSASQLADMDINLDGTVDVADLIAFLNGGVNATLVGYKWVVFASFPAGEGLSMPYNYTFILSIDATQATASTIDEFDPTKALLKQNLSGPGQVPGQNRAKYAPSLSVPAGATFSVSSGGSLVSLQTTGQVLASSSSLNPTGRVLTRSWTIVIDPRAVFDTTSLDHGDITETTSGFVPGQDTVNGGNVTLVRYVPNQLSPLGGP